MEVKSETKYIRVSPRKLRLVVAGIKGLNPKEAILRLSPSKKTTTRPIFLAIKAALANAVSNFKLKEENLRFKKIEVGQGPALKRWRPVAKGVAHPYKKRTSHIKIILEER